MTFSCLRYRTESGSERIKHATFVTTTVLPFQDFNANAYSTHAVCGWIPSLPLRVLYQRRYLTFWLKPPK
jgi:hypothetical protein